MTEAPSASVRKSAFAYLRVSTRKQDEENQRIQITGWAATHATEVLPGGWFVDKAVSGRKVPPMQREGFKGLFDTIQELRAEGIGPANVLVYELSRVGRNFWEMLEVVKTLEETCPIISTSPKESFLQIEDKSMRNFLLAILAWVAEREAVLDSQRTLEGLERARLEGRHSGPIPFGYRIDHAASDCAKLGHDPRTCDVHGVLKLTPDGRIAYDIVQAKPKAKPRDIRAALENLTSKQAWALLRNVKKFGDGMKPDTND